MFESTPRFDVSIVIEDSGDLLITETIVQEFGDTPRHGILRFIPNRRPLRRRVRPRLPDRPRVGDRVPNTPTDVETKDENGNFSIRIGDPDTTITGRHTYEIVYRVQGAMNGFADHDELFWNAIGDQWEQPIGEMNVRVSGPADVTRVACFQGTFGSTTPCDHAQITKKGDAVFSQSNLPAFQAMSVVVALPPGHRREHGADPGRALEPRQGVQPDAAHGRRGDGAARPGGRRARGHRCGAAAGTFGSGAHRSTR